MDTMAGFAVVEACKEWDCCVDQGGRVNLMRGLRGDVALPHGLVMRSGLWLKGKWMY